MKFTGEISIPAPREAVFAKVQDARFFASCVEGVQEMREIDPTHYTAVLETKVAYLKSKARLPASSAVSPPRRSRGSLTTTAARKSATKSTPR
jgi:carbon monoxide dehydrogenase subunit G